MNLVSEGRFGFNFLFFYVLDVMLQLELVIFILKLALAILLMLSSEQSFLLEIFSLEVVTELIDLPVQRVDHLVLAFDSIL